MELQTFELNPLMTAYRQATRTLLQNIGEQSPYFKQVSKEKNKWTKCIVINIFRSLDRYYSLIRKIMSVCRQAADCNNVGKFQKYSIMRCICLRLQKTSGPEPTIFKCMSTVWTPREMRRNITQAFAGTASIKSASRFIAKYSLDIRSSYESLS